MYFWQIARGSLRCWASGMICCSNPAGWVEIQNNQRQEISVIGSSTPGIPFFKEREEKKRKGCGFTDSEVDLHPDGWSPPVDFSLKRLNTPGRGLTGLGVERAYTRAHPDQWVVRSGSTDPSSPGLGGHTGNWQSTRCILRTLPHFYFSFLHEIYIARRVCLLMSLYFPLQSNGNALASGLLSVIQWNLECYFGTLGSQYVGANTIQMSIHSQATSEI